MLRSCGSGLAVGIMSGFWPLSKSLDIDRIPDVGEEEEEEEEEEEKAEVAEGDETRSAKGDET